MYLSHDRLNDIYGLTEYDTFLKDYVWEISPYVKLRAIYGEDNRKSYSYDLYCHDHYLTSILTFKELTTALINHI